MFSALFSRRQLATEEPMLNHERETLSEYLNVGRNVHFLIIFLRPLKLYGILMGSLKKN